MSPSGPRYVPTLDDPLSISDEDPPDWAEAYLTSSQLENLRPRTKWVLLLDPAPLPASAHHVALRLHIFIQGQENDFCYPSVAYLAQCTGMGQTTVKRALALLAEFGWLHVVRRRKPGSLEYASNIYVFTWPKPEAFDAEVVAIAAGHIRGSR